MSGDADRARERGLDSRLAAIAGEASEQRVPADRATSEGAPPFDVWHRGPSERVSSEAPTYYDRPVVKEPTWIWTVPAYFFSGGAAGASAVLAGVAWAIDVDANRTLVNRARWLAAAGTGIGSVFLIADLGRPERFLNMLRVLRSSSPMSVGSWTLAACGGASAAALLEPLGGALGLLGQAAGVASAMTGPPLAAYPAVLVSNTAVPLWRSVGRSLPALFVASAASSAASILQLTVRADRDRGVLRTYAAMGLAAEAIYSVVPFTGSARRTLHVARKVAPTPPGYPRRAGMAVKRPLTAKTLR